MADAVRPGERDGILAFCALACAITWTLDAPLAVSWARGATPPAYALPLCGLGAFGPTLAAVLVASRQGKVRAIFARWRTAPRWIAIALVLPLVLHLIATAIYAALGGHPAHWFYPPDRPEYVAGLVFFSIGEEFGWRGFAYPRLERRFGAVAAALVLGVVWGVWHFGMMCTAEHGLPALADVASFVLELALLSVIVAWVFERSGRSLWVALAVHAGGHLDNPSHGPESEVGLQVLRVVVVAIAAALAAWRLRARPPVR